MKNIKLLTLFLGLKRINNSLYIYIYYKEYVYSNIKLSSSYLHTAPSCAIRGLWLRKTDLSNLEIFTKEFISG